MRRVLDPIDRVSEVIFGLLMALAITGSLSVASAGEEEVRSMMFAALGCNIAWGLVDGIMYLAQTLTERTRRANLVARLHATPGTADAHALIAGELPERLGDAADATLLESLRRHLLALPRSALDTRLLRNDYAGALGVLLLVIVSTFPVVIPYAFIDELKLAMRVSNLVALVTLFAGGWILARHSGGSPWKSGLAMAATGAALSAAIIALGG
jgi:VIT1/CCC1 family predicted Fe2+/Mn2+ transporter